MQEIIDKIAEELSLPPEVIVKTYRAYWLFIRSKIEVLPLKEELTEEQFSKLRTNFNLPHLGKLSCNYKRWSGVKKKFKILTNEDT